MKKIMFNDRYGLTRKVLSGCKTQTRRVIPDIEIDWVVHLPVGGYEHGVLFMDVRSILHDAGISDYAAPAKYQPKYEVGEEVAVAQSYSNLREVLAKRNFKRTDTLYDKFYRAMQMGEAHDGMPGWSNKMFVRADLMPHSIRITDIRVERLQDISEEGCIREGVWLDEELTRLSKKNGYGEMWRYSEKCCYASARGAFAALIDKVSGKGTWQRNPWVFVYEFELVK